MEDLNQNSSADSGGRWLEHNPKLTSSSYSKLALPRTTVAPSVLAEDNPVMRWLAIEEDMHDPKLLEMKALALNNVESVMSKAVAQLRGDPRPVGDKIKDVYKVMTNEGFQFKEFDKTDIYGASLTYSLAKKQLDCDTSSSLVIGVAKVLGWPDVNAANVPGHAFVRWNKRNFDFGESLPDQYYVDKYSEHPEKAELNGLRAVEAQAWFARGITQQIQNQKHEAITDYSKAIELNPNDSAVYTALGNAYSNIGSTKEAISNYSRAIELHPHSPSAFRGRGNMYAQDGEYQRAIDDYSRALELNPTDAVAYYNRGNTYAQLGSSALATKDYSKVLEIDPQNSDAFVNRGNMHAKDGASEQAASDYSKAIEVNPKHPLAYYNRSVALEATGRYQEAATDYYTAVELDPAIAKNPFKPHLVRP